MIIGMNRNDVIWFMTLARKTSLVSSSIFDIKIPSYRDSLSLIIMVSQPCFSFPSKSLNLLFGGPKHYTSNTILLLCILDFCEIYLLSIFCMLQTMLMSFNLFLGNLVGRGGAKRTKSFIPFGQLERSSNYNSCFWTCVSEIITQKIILLKWDSCLFLWHL